MADGDFAAVVAIAAERPDISIFLSSTPTGRRSFFYEACVNKDLGYKEFYYPSMANPNWGDEMEAEFRSSLTELQYIHEVLAEFGPQETGVFDKKKLDEAIKMDLYAYAELDYLQERALEVPKENIKFYIPQKGERGYYPNKYRTMGVDWDKYQASSSIIIEDYDIKMGKFRVIKRIEVPKSEYSYDAAVNMIVELNNIYNPSFIYVDRGAGEYQIERLHIIGEERPETGLKDKLKGFQFKQTLEIIDPATKVVTKEPMKPFMVNQLSIMLERGMMMLSPFDETLYKQLVDYSIVRISSNGVPIYSSENEHFVDALGLAHLAFVLEFPHLTMTIKKLEHATKAKAEPCQLNQNGFLSVVKDIASGFNVWSNKSRISKSNDLSGDKQTWFKNEGRPGGAIRRKNCSWGGRFNNGPGRSMW